MQLIFAKLSVSHELSDFKIGLGLWLSNSYINSYSYLPLQEKKEKVIDEE